MSQSFLWVGGLHSTFETTALELHLLLHVYKKFYLLEGYSIGEKHEFLDY